MRYYHSRLVPLPSRKGKTDLKSHFTFLRRSQRSALKPLKNKNSYATLDTARAQHESLRKNQASALETQVMSLSAEKEAAVQAVETKATSREDDLNKSIAELRAHLPQVVDNAGWREDQLRRENDELRMPAEQLQARNEELSVALPNTTRPLIRQVEALQSAAEEKEPLFHSESAKQAVDRSYMERLRVDRASAAGAGEREHDIQEHVSEVLTRCAAVEEHVKLAQTEMSRANPEAVRVQADLGGSETRWRKDADETRARADRLENERDDALS